MHIQHRHLCLGVPVGFILSGDQKTGNWIMIPALPVCSILKKCTWLALLLVCLLSNEGQGFTKVVVPAVYKEWASGTPDWVTSPEIQAKYNYSVFLYQKLDPDAPNYFGFNRGRENGVFLQYIVDHYHSFPDVAVFIHAKPHEHQKNWLEMIGCISPNATYYNINYGGNPWVTRTPAYWSHAILWTEQCWRDTLQAAFDLRSDDAEFQKRIPVTWEIMVSMPCCNQFVLSRGMVHKRPLRVWKELLNIIGVQDACHVGEPDYESLYYFNHTGRVKIGPEPRFIAAHGEDSKTASGRVIQACTLEHLSHVVFGHEPLDMAYPDDNVKCRNFLPHCPHSPCTRS